MHSPPGSQLAPVALTPHTSWRRPRPGLFRCHRLQLRHQDQHHRRWALRLAMSITNASSRGDCFPLPGPSLPAMLLPASIAGHRPRCIARLARCPPFKATITCKLSLHSRPRCVLQAPPPLDGAWAVVITYNHHLLPVPPAVPMQDPHPTTCDDVAEGGEILVPSTAQSPAIHHCTLNRVLALQAPPPPHVATWPKAERSWCPSPLSLPAGSA